MEAGLVGEIVAGSGTGVAIVTVEVTVIIASGVNTAANVEVISSPFSFSDCLVSVVRISSS